MSDAGGTGSPDEEPIEVFGPYQLLDVLGRGGMGEVWRAWDTRRERTVAVKRLAGSWADVPSFRQRFRLEARTTARLVSEHVIVIHDFGEIDGRLFIDMRLVGGGDLADALDTAPDGLGVRRSADLTAQIADALDAAHREELIHRDVKPSNVLLARDGAGHRAYLVDFGIAKLGDEVTGGGLTMTGATMGTPAYMAPELFDGAAAASPASDVYALGCVLFEMLTGRRVFLGTTPTGLMADHVSRPAPPPSSIRPELVPFDPVLERALDKSPARRHPSAGELAADVARAAERCREVGGRGGSGAPVGPSDPTIAPSTDPSAGPTVVVPTVGSPSPGAPEDAGRARGQSWPARRVALLAVAAVAAVVVVAVVVVAVVVAEVRTGSTGTGPSAAAPPPAAPSVAAPSVAVPRPTGPPRQVPVSLDNPGGVALSPDGRRIYIANTGANSVTALDVASGATIASIPVGPEPAEIAVSRDGRRAYVTDPGNDQDPSNAVSVIDLGTNTVVATLPVGRQPVGIAVSPDGRRAYVANYGEAANPGNTVSVIDTAANAVVATVTVGLGPDRLVVSPDGRFVYVPELGSASAPGSAISVIDTATNTATPVPAGDANPISVAATTDGSKIYVASQGPQEGSGSIHVLDAATRTSLPVGGQGLVNVPVEAAVTPDGRTLVVTNYGFDTTPDTAVSVIDVATATARRVPVQGRPYGVAVSPDGGEAWVTTNQPGVVGLWRIPLG